ESLQDNTVFRKMQKVITKKVLDHLDTVSTEDKERYTKFYQEFGAILREGVASDFDNRERVARLMRFASTRTGVDGEQVSLPEYVERMAEGQEQIYFLTGTDPKAILRDPNLEVFTKRNLEVLLLVDPVDEYMLGQLRSFDEKDIVSVDSAELKLPENAQQEEGSDDTEQKGDADQAADGPGFERLLELFSEALGERVREVRRSERLTSSACCLVNAEGTMSTTMQRVLRMNTPDFEMGKMILEVNPQSDFIRRLSAICVNPQNADFIRTCGLQLHSNAMITAGLAPDPNEMAARVQDFMLQLAGSRSAIATE
ncbi:MAG: molecular chaperone HtpG, partial [Planctomycetaceae bacterium]|nr:molecular chaperone HtpG [Planctomycetaceae bacterium]